MSKKKKTPKRAAKKKKAPQRNASKRTEIVLRVESQPMAPTVSDLSEPIRDGRSLTIPKTWLSEKQITRLVERTPEKFIYQRPAKGGGKWDYVTVGYVQRVLDYAFGFNWDFEIVEHGKEADHVWVLGKLTVRNPQGTMQITKTQFGRSDVKQKKDGGNLDYGNDLKAAASDSLKKCASMLGIARDIYSKGDYKAESGNEPREPQRPSGPALPPPTGLSAIPDGPVEELYCHGASRGGCPEGAEIDRATADYSKKVYGKQLCRNCQKRATPIKK